MIRLLALTVSLAALSIAQAPLRYQTKTVEKKNPGCLVSAEYPEVTSAASREVRDRINAGILQLLLRSSPQSPNHPEPKSLDEFAKKFTDDCVDNHESAKGTPADHPLYQRKIVDILRTSPPVFSLRCVTNGDSGGVHPFGTTFFANFATATGKPVTLADILQPGAMPRLRSLAEQQFRKDHKMSATESPSQSGFDFPGDVFKLNENYGIGENALIFVFNTYEIAAGAMGETKIEIPFAAMRDLLKLH